MTLRYTVVRTACLAALALIVLPSLSWGGVVFFPNVIIEVGVEGNTVELQPGGIANSDSITFDFDGSVSDSNNEWDLNWDLTVDPDPLISAVFALTNTTATTKTYILSVSVPIAPTVVPSSLIGGSMGLTVTDSNGDGVGTVTSATPSPVYSGLIDGTGALPLLPDPFSISVPFANGTAVISASAGLPGPTIPGPPAFSTIGILHKFTLTPGDSIGLTSIFVVEAIPEPSSLALGGLGLLALVAGSRRRHSK